LEKKKDNSLDYTNMLKQTPLAQVCKLEHLLSILVPPDGGYEILNRLFGPKRDIFLKLTRDPHLSDKNL
jgi:hypothetical protein